MALDNDEGSPVLGSKEGILRCPTIMLATPSLMRALKG